MNFRSLAKEHIPGQAPIRVVSLIRERAARERRSASSVVTELICIGLGEDPKKYGIKPKPEPLANAS